MNLNQVTVPVKDLEKSYLFYQKLGLVPIVKSPHYARFECPEGESTFSIHQSDDIQNQHATVVYFESDNLDAVVEQLIVQGIEFDQMPVDQSWLWREASLKDPDGNKIILYYAGKNRKNPPWKL